MHIAGVIRCGIYHGVLKPVPIGLLLVALHLFNRLRCGGVKTTNRLEIISDLTDKYRLAGASQYLFNVFFLSYYESLQFPKDVFLSAHPPSVVISSRH